MQKNEKLLTIVITAYNEEKYIARCLDSVINSCKDYLSKLQIIVSNNNSSDKTLEIAQEYQKKISNIEVSTTRKQGPSVARNEGIRLAKGKYITFFDGDDYVKDSFKDVLNLIGKNDQIDCFQMSYQIEKSGEAIIPELCKKENYNLSLDLSTFVKNINLNTSFSSSSSRIFKTQLLKENELFYNENFMQMEDMEFSIRAISDCKTFMFLPDIYYVYETRHENSLTHKISLSRMLQGVNASFESMSYLINNNANKKLKQFVSLMSYSLIRRCKELSKQDRKIFIQNLKEKKIILKYPAHLSTKLFYIFSKTFGIKFALMFV